MLANSHTVAALLSQAVFVAVMAVIVFTYIGYPALMFALGFILYRPIRRGEITPKVTIIIAAYNEERDIEAKLKNTLAFDYPRGRMEIIVASDCSSDRTNEIVRGFASQGVILRQLRRRSGKTIAQNQAIKVSSGDILLFTDATTICESGAIRKIVRNFADSEVGCVAGQLYYIDENSSAIGAGCKKYWQYEKFVKVCESRIGSLVGVSGCLYAVRRLCHSRAAGDMIDDFAIATEIHLQGLRTIYEPEAIAVEKANRRGKDEFRMRVRVIKQSLSALNRYRHTLNPFQHKMFAIQMIAHKALRYAAPFLLLTAFISSAIGSRTILWLRVALAGQLLLYGAALVGFILERNDKKLKLLSAPYYFVMGNLAALVAFFKALRGDNYVVWEPIRYSIKAEGRENLEDAPEDALITSSSNEITAINGEHSEYPV